MAAAHLCGNVGLVPVPAGRYHFPPHGPPGTAYAADPFRFWFPVAPLIRMELHRHQNDAPSIRLWLWVTAIELLVIVVLLRLAS
jgi:hypothetical protein